MSGAYVSKPDAAVPSTYPDGWNILWTFPGPFPPGYTPVLALSLTAPASVIIGGSAEVSTALKDHVTYVTSEPVGSLSWSAKWSDTGSPVGLKVSGDSLYSSVVPGTYSVIDGFYGQAPTFEFNASASDNGRVITLKVESEPFDGYPVSNTKNITVALSNVYTLSLTFTVECDNEFAFYNGTNFYILIAASESDYAVALMGYEPEEPWSGHGGSDNFTFTIAAREIAISGLLFAGSVYAFSVTDTIDFGDGEAFDYNVTCNIKCYKNGVIEHEVNEIYTTSTAGETLHDLGSYTAD